MADENTSSDAKAMEDKQEKVQEAAEQAVEVAQEAAVEAQEAAAEAKEAVQEVKAEEPKKETKAVSKELEGISAPLSNSLKEIVEKIEKLTVLELADLVHALEDKFGVTASAPMAMAAAGAPAAGADAAPAEEQTAFDVILANAGANKIGVIKAVREIVPTLGLKEAKDLVEAAPKPVLEGVKKEAAEEAKAKLTAAGATVELK